MSSKLLILMLQITQVCSTKLLKYVLDYEITQIRFTKLLKCELVGNNPNEAHYRLNLDNVPCITYTNVWMHISVQRKTMTEINILNKMAFITDSFGTEIIFINQKKSDLWPILELLSWKNNEKGQYVWHNFGFFLYITVIYPSII